MPGNAYFCIRLSDLDPRSPTLCLDGNSRLNLDYACFDEMVHFSFSHESKRDVCPLPSGLLNNVWYTCNLPVIKRAADPAMYSRHTR